MKRHYLLSVMRSGGIEFWPQQCVTTDMRIRPAALVLFRKWFGYPANDHWHKDGFMAEAWDRRQNKIQLEQINHDMKIYKDVGGPY